MDRTVGDASENGCRRVRHRAADGLNGGRRHVSPEYKHDRAYEAQFRIPVVDLLRYALRHGFVDTLPAEQRAAFDAVVRVALVRDGDAA